MLREGLGIIPKGLLDHFKSLDYDHRTARSPLKAFKQVFVCVCMCLCD